MIGLLQRVRHAAVDVEQQRIAEIGAGLLVLVGVQPHDTEASAARLLQRLLGYRVFADDQGRMNRSLRDLAADNAGLLLVPQFTLAADTRSGTRASFTSAADPQLGRQLFEFLVSEAQRAWPRVGSGNFGADMQVSLVNDGPVTFWLQV
jgi:D-tyrosyl-tRNA(Tyr) deacylase